MTAQTTLFRNGPIFDGTALLAGHCARFENGVLVSLAPDTGQSAPSSASVVDLNGDILSHGYVDLQVNGGGGVMLNGEASADDLRRISAAHRSLGTVWILPTLITDTPQATQAAIRATIAAVQAGCPGIAGLHLEGPHLSVARKGAHDGELIRPMEQADLAVLLDAARALPVLKVTVAPENVTQALVRRLSDAGVLVALGHSDATYDTSRAYMQSGAACVTHLFNAMSQMTSRAPGLVGAALDTHNVHSGLIADGIHVHPAPMRLAWQAMAEGQRLYLVSDAMAVAGTDQASFELGGRLIQRANGRLTLQNGTLAGADLDLTTALRVLRDDCGIPLPQALASATTVPGALIGKEARLCPKARTPLRDIIRIASDLSRAQPITPAG